MKPLPWSYTALSTFTNCPKQYYHKYVAKDVKEVKSQQQLWGTSVHEAFEARQGPDRVALPDELAVHEPFMQKIEGGWEGSIMVELDAALNKRLQPCGFFSDDVWWRGKVDLLKYANTLEGKQVTHTQAKIVDYKTGKIKPDFRQLKLFALWGFYYFPKAPTIDVEFYWTVDQSTTRKVYGRAEIPEMWGSFVGDLKQYAEAFATEKWQPRPSGLCNGWCPVKDCQHWKPRRT